MRKVISLILRTKPRSRSATPRQFKTRTNCLALNRSINSLLRGVCRMYLLKMTMKCPKVMMLRKAKEVTKARIKLIRVWQVHKWTSVFMRNRHIRNEKALIHKRRSSSICWDNSRTSWTRSTRPMSKICTCISYPCCLWLHKIWTWLITTPWWLAGRIPHIRTL